MGDLSNRKKPLYDEDDMSKGNCYSIVYCKKEKAKINPDTTVIND